MNYEEIAQDAKKTNGNINNVTSMANKMLQWVKKIENLEQELKDSKATLYQLETQELPDEMDACGLKEFVLSNGQKISVEAIISASLPSKGAIDKADDCDRPILEHRLNEGLQFLRDNGAESLIKNILEFELDKGKDNVVSKLIEIADELGIPHHRDQKVHSQTLNKYIKDRIRDGKAVPMDTFSVYSGRKASIVKSKSKKGENL